MFIWVYTYVGCHSLNELYKGKEKTDNPTTLQTFNTN